MPAIISSTTKTRRNSGHTLPELLVALTLFGLLSISAASVFRSHTRLAQRAVDRAERADALRVATLVLGAETRFLRADRDVRLAGPDSIMLRAYRGMGVVCSVSDKHAIIRYTGIRDPNPQKDSVILLRGDSGEIAAEVTSVDASSSCKAYANEQVWKLALTVAASPGDIVLLFEPGRYYLSGSALRYRIGAEGRQPITTERMDDRNTRFEDIRSGALRLSLATRAVPALGEHEQMRVRLPILNQAP